MTQKFLLLFCLSLIALACRKTGSTEEQVLRIDLNDCVQKTFSNQSLTVCFDSVLQDSRCPVNAECIWQGVAQARFQVSVNNQQHLITLSSNELLPGSSVDTTVAGFTFTFVNLHPYPGQAPANTNAEVKVSR